jgi:hypothetical protein
MGHLNDHIEREALGIANYGMHTHTVEQELLTLKQRHLVRTPDPNLQSVVWGLARKVVDNLKRQLPKLAKAPLSDLTRGKTGRARARFVSGWHEYFQDGLQRYHSRISCMQKVEFHPNNKLEKKADRAIQYRSVAYNAALARYLQPIEHALFNHTTYQGMRWCAKGLTHTERALQIIDMACEFRDPVFVLADHSTFDAHVNPSLLKLEHRLYKQQWAYNSELCSLLQQQVDNRGATKSGIRYKVKGTRMSGDVNTALGNSVVNMAMLGAWLDKADARVLLDGDDSVVVMERDTLPTLRELGGFMLDFGMVTTYEVVDRITDVEFCQQKPVLGPNGPYLCPKPQKLLDVILKCPRRLDSAQARAVLRGSIQCTAITNHGMPMIKPLINWFNSDKGPTQLPDWLAYRVTNGYSLDPTNLGGRIQWQEPTDDERLSYWLAWGITPADQVAYESNTFVPLVSGKVKTSNKLYHTIEPLEEPDSMEWMEQQQAITSDNSVVAWADRSEDWRQAWRNHLTHGC